MTVLFQENGVLKFSVSPKTPRMIHFRDVSLFLMAVRKYVAVIAFIQILIWEISSTRIATHWLVFVYWKHKSLCEDIIDKAKDETDEDTVEHKDETGEDTVEHGTVKSIDEDMKYEEID